MKNQTENRDLVIAIEQDDMTFAVYKYAEDDGSTSLSIHRTDLVGDPEIATINAADGDESWEGRCQHLSEGAWKPSPIWVRCEDGDTLAQVAGKAILQYAQRQPRPDPNILETLVPMVRGHTEVGVAETDRKCSKCGGPTEWVQDSDGIDTDKKHHICTHCRQLDRNAGIWDDLLRQITGGR